MEQMLRLLHACGMPAGDVDFINGDGLVMHKLLMAVREEREGKRGEEGKVGDRGHACTRPHPPK